MADTIVIDGDVSKAQDALKRLNRATDASVARVGQLASAFAKAEQNASDLAEAARRVPKREGAAEEQEDIKRLVRLRELEADELEHQVVLLREVGAEQTKIAATERASLERRKEAATLANDRVAITKVRRQQEVAAATEIGERNAAIARQQKEASEASSKRLTAIKGHWREIVAVALAVVGAIKAADAAMKQAFGQRTVLANLPFQIGAAREATLGFIGDVKLSEVAITAQRLKIVKTEEDFGRLANAATKLGLSVGRDATSALNDLTGALGRGSTEVLDNLGIQLKVNEAHKIYAAQLGITTKALTDDQKAEAFRVVGLQRALEAAENVTVKVQSQEMAWIGARRRLDELVRETVPEATKRMGGLWTALDAGTELVQDAAPVFLGYLDGVITGLKPAAAVVGFFGKQIGGIVRVVDVFGGMISRGTERVGEFADQVGAWISDSIAGDAARWVSDTAESVVKLADDSMSTLTESIEEQLPFTAELAKSWDEVTNALLGTEGAIGKLGDLPGQKALRDLAKDARKFAAERKAQDAAQLQGLKDRAAATEFAVKLGEAEGRPNRVLEGLYRDQLKAKLQLLSATGDIAKIEEAQQDEQLRVASKRRRGGGQGPSQADRLKATAEIQIAQWRAELEQIELVGELRGTANLDAKKNALVRHNIAVQDLELERQVLEVTRGKTSVDRERNAARLEAIDGEIQILSLERQISEQRRDAEATTAANEAVLLTMDREIERLQSLGVATQMLERDRAAAHQAQVEAFGTSQEIAAVQFEQQIAENERRREREIEIEERKLLVFEQDAELAEARGQQVEDLAVRRLELEAQVAAAEGNADKQRALLHKRDVARIKDAAAKRKAAAGAASSLLTSGQSLFSTVVGVAIKDEKKREKAALRARGVEALARGALETVEAVSSFASFNFVQGALHTAAAAVAFTQGGLMLAGKIPGGGTAGAGASSGGSQGPSAVVAPGQERQQRELGPVPTSAEALINARGQGDIADSGDQGGGGQGGDVINIGLAISSDNSQLLNDMSERQRLQAWGS